MSSTSTKLEAASSIKLEHLLQDLRFAARMLRKYIGFTLLSIVVLALLGASTAIFSVVNVALLQPLPYADVDRIVQVWHTPPQKKFFGMKQFAVSIANFLDWKNQQHVFQHIALYRFTSLNVSRNGKSDSVSAAADRAYHVASRGRANMRWWRRKSREQI